VVCYLHLNCEFQVQVCISLIDVAPSFELDHVLLLANIGLFCRPWWQFTCVYCSLLSDWICLSVWCWLLVWIVYWLV
jgi:hypothetical protein